MTEANLELLDAMRQQVGYLHVEIDELWTDLQRCRALSKMYEDLLRKHQVDLSIALEDEEMTG